tara:strand:- start:3906 stop:4865 length:960 start_codon:yes stop_codon:yes gene_type:complete
MKVLITGITGNVGSHLADYILENHSNAKVYGLLRWRSPLDNVENIKDEINLVLADLNDLNSMINALESIKPDIVFHLAAQSFVQFSFAAPAETLNTNVIGTSNLLEAIRLTKIKPKIHICSSSEVYGQVKKNEVPITESNPFRPASPYAVSKVAEDMLGYQYYLSYDMHIVRTRMFTHTGPRRGDVFAESWFAKQIAMVEKKIIMNPIKVGNLDSIRTIMDVRDAVRAYWMMMEKSPAGEVYNIGGDTTVTVKEILNKLIEYSDKDIEYKTDPSLLRPSDVTLQIPNTDKFKKLTGWEPQIKYEDTLLDLLNYQREKIK